MLAEFLDREGFDVVVAFEAPAPPLELPPGPPPDLVVLDVMLPGRSGFDLLRELRAREARLPILMLTARGDAVDRILGLELGADDYLSKPFDLDELEARIRALHRRAGGGTGDDSAAQAVACGQLRLDTASGAIHQGFKVLDLSPREAALLRALLLRQGRAMAKEQLFEVVFPGAAEVQYEAIEVVAYRLRKKLAGTGAALVTLRGLGYLLKAEG
jgi:two-component system response regulator TctD